MMKLNYSVIAGGSEGIGAGFANHQASEGHGLVLIARNQEKLDLFAATIRNTFNVDVRTLSLDLSSSDAVKTITKETEALSVHTFIYNAALSHIGKFEQQDAFEHEKMAHVNMITPLRLTRHFGERMLRKNHGNVILMSSLAGFQGSGFLTTYAASKAFNTVLAEGLWYEWRKRGVNVLACCAGATSSPNYIKTNPKKTSFFAPKVQTPDEVVQECFKNLGKTPSFISGKGNRMASLIIHRLLSRKKAVQIMGDNTSKMYEVT